MREQVEMSNFPLPYSSLKRSTKPIRPRKKAQRRVGKEGIVRLSGAAMDALRLACWTRDRGRCQECGIATFYESRFDGDPQAYDMAHIRNKRMYGDTLDNVKTHCHKEHMRQHTEGVRG